MTDRKLNPIAWTEGMFLRPQHMQFHDQTLQDQIDYHLRAVDPFHWGVRECRINEKALGEGRVEIVSLEAVLAEGTIIHYPGGATVEPREFSAEAQHVEVWIGVRDVSPTTPNTSPIDDAARDVRFKVASEDIPDLHRGGNSSPVEVLLPNVRVFISGEEEELETHDTIKLAEIVATGDANQRFAVSRTYAPPLLAIQAHGPLHEEVREVAAHLASKIAVLAERAESISVVEMPKFMMLYTLSRVTPLVRHLLSVAETRPFQLYTVLIEAAGALATFAHKEVADLPLYDHEDLYGCFHELLGFIDSHIEEAAPVRFTRLDLTFDPRRKAYTTDGLEVRLVHPRNRYVLAIKAEMDSQELVHWIEEKGKAGSAAHVPILERRALTGLRLERLPGQPVDISGPSGAEYFKVEPHGKQWARVSEEFTFGLSLGPLTDAEVSLFIVTDEE